jgi:flavoprotein
VVPHLGSTIVPSHPTLYRLNMWSSWVRRNGTTQVMYVTKLKNGSKRVKKIFSMILEKVLKWYDGGEKMRSHQKRNFELEVSLSSQNVNFPFI